MNSPALSGGPDPGVGSSPDPSITGWDSRSRYPKWSCALSNGGTALRSSQDRTSTPLQAAISFWCFVSLRLCLASFCVLCFVLACWSGLGDRLDLAGDRREPGPSRGAVVKRQKLIAAGQGGRAGQQDVLDVVELKHCPRRRHRSLHQIEHLGEGRLQPQRLLDFIPGHVGVLAIFQKAGTLMVANECYEGSGVDVPVLREAFEIFEHCRYPARAEQLDGVLGVFVEIRVKYPLVHEICFAVDGEQQPAKIVQLQNFKAVRLFFDRLFDDLRMVIESLFAARNDLRQNGEAVGGWRLWKDRSIATLLEPEETLLGNCQCGRGIPSLSAWWIGHEVRSYIGFAVAAARGANVSEGCLYEGCADKLDQRLM